MNRFFRNPRFCVPVLAVVATVGLIFVVIPVLTGRLHQEYNQEVFADGYDYIANTLASGHGYRFYPETARTMMREPGYPLLLTGLMLAFGSSFAAVKVVNVCLALATAWLMTLLARRVSSSPVLVFAPPLLFLFHPGVVVAECRGGPEMLITFLLVLFMVLFFRALESSRWLVYGLSGLVLGFAVLVKSTPILFPLFLLAYLVLVERQNKAAALGRFALIMAAIFAVLSPWIARNYALTGKFVPTASVFGVSAQAGQYMCEHRSSGEPLWQLDREAAYQRDDLARGLGLRFKTDDFYYQTFYDTTDELRFSSYLAARVKDEYAHHPLVCVKCMAENLVYFWIAGKTQTSTMTNALIQLPYLVLGIAGLVFCIRDGQFKAIGLLLFLIVYVIGVHAPILAQARYSIPLLPFISILAGAALERAWSHRTGLVAQAQPVEGPAGLRSRDAGFVRFAARQKETQ